MAPTYPPPKIRLLSTDFDGTLVDHEPPAPFVPELIDAINTLRAHGVLWVVNTGRSPRLLDQGLEHYGWTIRPDYAITSEREVCQPAAEGLPAVDGTRWADFGDWNARCAKAHHELFAGARPIMREILAFLRDETGAQPLFDPTPSAEAEDQPAGLVSSGEAEMDRIAHFLDGLKARLPKLSYQRNRIYLRFCHADYDKGIALSELGRLLNIPAEARFAIGDHHNDIPMLNGRHARHVACPENAVAEVKDVVRRAQGYIAGAPCSSGVVEAMRFYFTDIALPGSMLTF